MIETIFIARHGYRMNWITHDWKSPTGLPRDPPLASFGLTQAQELADLFLSLPDEDRPTAIFSSPYYRCLQTSKPVSVALQVPIYVEHGLSEWYSPVVPGTGLHPRPSSASVLRAHIPEIDSSWSSVWYPSRKGEDIEQCHDRCRGLLSALIPEIEHRFGDKHKRILLVSHAATIIALVRELMGDRDMILRVGCCSLTELVPKRSTSAAVSEWEARRFVDGAHLKEGASREWGFEDVELAGGRVIEHPGQGETDQETDWPVGLHLLSEPPARM